MFNFLYKQLTSFGFLWKVFEWWRALVRSSHASSHLQKWKAKGVVQISWCKYLMSFFFFVDLEFSCSLLFSCLISLFVIKVAWNYFCGLPTSHFKVVEAIFFFLVVISISFENNSNLWITTINLYSLSTCWNMQSIIFCW